MRRHAALPVLAFAALLLTTGATGQPPVPGDETPPQVTPVILGSLGLEGWYVTNVTVNWRVEDPESVILETEGCNATTLTADTAGITLRCRAVSDGGETSISKTFRLDKTAPTASAGPDRGTDVNGWYNHALTVGFNGSDAMSGLASCTTPQNYAGPDSGDTSVGGTCKDVAGNSTAASFPFKYDATAPQNNGGTPSRAPNAQGWYNAQVTVAFGGTDATSGVDTCTSVDYSGPDDPSTSVTGTCKDKAGNQSASRTFALKYDETDPAVTGKTPSRAADENGWYNHSLTVTFAGSDATSGVDTCTQATYSGPDSGGASVPGTCRDRAGNVSGTSTFALQYDATAPQVTGTPGRPADANGWFNHGVSVSFSGSDPTSGLGACDAPKTYAGPDDPAATVPGTCRDKAGNVGSTSYGLKYDGTVPVVTPSPDRAANPAGWYRTDLTVTFGGSDATSGIDTCTAAKTYSGPDTATASVDGSCSDKAGNSASRVFGFKYDETNPQVSAIPSRGADANGWYNQALSVRFEGTDVTSGIASCSAPKSYNTPDSATASVDGSCSDAAGNSASKAFGFKYDQTAPQVTGSSPSRAPDKNGWYNQALSVGFQGSDATSGIASCTQAPYSGPDSATASVTGTCRDNAANTSAASSFPLKYDATVPQVTGASPSRTADKNGWYNHALTVGFQGSDVTSGVDACSQVGYGGPDSATASVTGSCLDKAGNQSAAGSFPLKYDGTAPQVTAAPDRQVDANGWYNHSLTVTFTGSDATSLIDVCDAPKSYSGPDNANTSVTGSCSDKAGNSASKAFALKYDATDPQTTAAPSRAADSNGWWNHGLSVGFSGSDAMSGIGSCDAPKDYSGPDSTNAVVTGKCLDVAGNDGVASASLKYDATAPQVNATPDRAANTNGWYRALVTVTFTGTDGVSQVDSCDLPKTYDGPDSATGSVSGSCRDKAGNSGSKPFALKFDKTAPQVTPSPSRPADANGWYNHGLSVAFQGTDATSLIDSCDPAKTYSGPDSGGTSIGGSCRDKAGNSGTGSLALKYDDTDPQNVHGSPARVPDANGWYNDPIAIDFVGTDPTSGLGACTKLIYTGPDTADTAVGGSCSDRAGNPSGPSTFPLKYDATAPQVTDATPVRPADHAGWFTRPVAFTVQGNDGTAGIAACPAATYGGPDAGNAHVDGACFDRAGNRGAKAFPLQYDATGPQVTVTPTREPDRNGWYNRSVDLAFSGSDTVSGLDSCDSPESYAGPDSGFSLVGGTCSDRAGNVGAASYALRYDATAPQVLGAQPDRAPDGNGWYNHAIGVGFIGSDAVSEIESCTKASYAGPDSSLASVSGSCTDKAGNQSNPGAFPLKYDSNAPAAARLTVKAGNRTAALTWDVSDDTSVVELLRSAGTSTTQVTVYRGTGSSFTDTQLENGVHYRYELKSYDDALNLASTSAAATPLAPLYGPVAGARVTAPPLLAWQPKAGVKYYNVRVYRAGRPIFSAWPTRASFRLKKAWTYHGRRYRLAPGSYRWYVWPGIGRMAKKRYGALLGSSYFVVVAKRSTR